MNLIQYSNLYQKERQEGLFKRYPYLSVWDKTFSKIVFGICIGILAIFLFRYSFTPLGEKLQEAEAMQVPLEVTFLSTEESTYDIEEVSIPENRSKEVSKNNSAIQIPLKNDDKNNFMLTKRTTIDIPVPSNLEKSSYNKPDFEERVESSSLVEVISESIGKYEGKVLDIEPFYSLLKKLKKSVKFGTFVEEIDGGIRVSDLPSPYREIATQDRIELSNKYSFIKVRTPEENIIDLESTAADIIREVERLGGWDNVQIRILFDRTDKYGRRMYIRFERKT